MLPLSLSHSKIVEMECLWKIFVCSTCIYEYNISQDIVDNCKYVCICTYYNRHAYLNAGHLYLQIALPQVILSCWNYICVYAYVYVSFWWKYTWDRFPHRFHRVQKGLHSWLPLGSTSSLVCSAVVVHVPSEHVYLCSDKYAFVMYYADGVCKIMLVVTCGDHHAVLANLHNWVCCPHTPLPSPMVYTK